jgi:adenylate cyclase
VLHTVLNGPDWVPYTRKEQVISVLFSDTENFTTLSERLSPRELVGLLNTYLTEMTAIVLEKGGDD